MTVPEKEVSRLRRWWSLVAPPDFWKLPVTLAAGVFVGLGLHVLYISEAFSYLSDDPRACVNCHVMNPQFATWQRGSHGRAATCNDCHVPHDNPLHTYYFKAQDGLRHSTMFTFRLEPQVIRIKDAGKQAVQQNCVRCHANQIHPVALRALSRDEEMSLERRYCWECHRQTPHGRVNSLSSAPYARVPTLSPVLPDWLVTFTSRSDRNRFPQEGPNQP